MRVEFAKSIFEGNLPEITVPVCNRRNMPEEKGVPDHCSKCSNQKIHVDHNILWLFGSKASLRTKDLAQSLQSLSTYRTISPLVNTGYQHNMHILL
jgi:hypothetical protein